MFRLVRRLATLCLALVAWSSGSDTLASAAPSPSPRARAAVEAVAGGQRLRLTVGGAEVPSPGAPERSRHEGAVWLDDGTLLAWLEGDDRERMAVRAGRWDGKRWTRVETVSPAGAGSQRALAGAVTAGGGAILLWSAFDGEDDEIVWSRRLATGWTSPVRLSDDNHAPDILPALAAGPGGVLAAWSRYDGNDYRVMVARLEDERWTAPETLGPKGSYHAALGAAPSGRFALVFESATGWEARELDRRGQPTGRIAALPAPPQGAERAAIEALDGDGLWVRWPDGATTARLRWR